MLQIHVEVPITVDPLDTSYIIFPNGKRIHRKQLKTLRKKVSKKLRRAVMAQCLKHKWENENV